MISPTTRSQDKYIVSEIKAIIETQKSTKRYYNYYKKILENTTIIIHYTTEKNSNLTVASMNCL